MSNTEDNKVSTSIEMVKPHDYPYYCTNGVKHVKLVNDHQGWEKINGKEEWTNYGSAVLCQQRLKEYKPCSREEYLTAR